MDDAQNKTDFSQLNLNSWLIRQCQVLGIKHPTPVQTNCIPAILAGMNCIGCAKTGSGKTLAFVLPILQRLFEDPYGIFALVITPTRELAYQIGDQFAVIGQVVNMVHCVITGGMDMIVQAQELAKHPHVVISTPGRLADHLESCNTFSLSRIKFLVLDEADSLLSGRFDNQMKIIFKALPPKERKQLLLFSATMTDTLHNLETVSSKEFYKWESSSSDNIVTVSELDQYYVLCPLNAKDGYLVETIRTFRTNDPDSSIMIFTNTCKNCQLLSLTLNEIGFENVPLHSIMSQKQRLSSLAKFKSNIVRILIATDVASRGLDIPTVSLVINHIVPDSPVAYIHRVGRTARAGRAGMAISLVTQYDIELIKTIERKINYRLREYSVSNEEVAKFLTQVKVNMREMEIKLDQVDFEERKFINKRKKLILEGKNPDRLKITRNKRRNVNINKKEKIKL